MNPENIIRAAVRFAALCILATDAVYRAGLASGRAVHAVSGFLVGLASGRIDRAQTARAVVSWAEATLTEPEPEPELISATLAVVAACAPVSLEEADRIAAHLSPPPLASLTVAQLRKLARARGMSGLARKGRRADLLSALL